jgi:hypothetical protein
MRTRRCATDGPSLNNNKNHDCNSNDDDNEKDNDCNDNAMGVGAGDLWEAKRRLTRTACSDGVPCALPPPSHSLSLRASAAAPQLRVPAPV